MNELPRTCVQCGDSFAVRDKPRDLLGPADSQLLCPNCAPPKRSRMVAKNLSKAGLAVAALALPVVALIYDWLSNGFAPSSPQIEARDPEPAPPSADYAVPNAQVRPLNSGSWVTTYDYPLRALAENREGTVAFTLAINAMGQASDCKITQSSGHADLDAATCLHLMARARFAPARGQDGRAITSEYANRVTWKIDQ